MPNFRNSRREFLSARLFSNDEKWHIVCAEFGRNVFICDRGVIFEERVSTEMGSFGLLDAVLWYSEHPVKQLAR